MTERCWRGQYFFLGWSGKFNSHRFIEPPWYADTDQLSRKAYSHLNTAIPVSLSFVGCFIQTDYSTQRISYRKVNSTLNFHKMANMIVWKCYDSMQVKNILTSHPEVWASSELRHAFQRRANMVQLLREIKISPSCRDLLRLGITK